MWWTTPGSLLQQKYRFGRTLADIRHCTNLVRLKLVHIFEMMQLSFIANEWKYCYKLSSRCFAKFEKILQLLIGHISSKFTWRWEKDAFLLIVEIYVAFKAVESCYVGVRKYNEENWNWCYNLYFSCLFEFWWLIQFLMIFKMRLIFRHSFFQLSCMFWPR
jgi:hypothetical protein